MRSTQIASKRTCRTLTWRINTHQWFRLNIDAIGHCMLFGGEKMCTQAHHANKCETIMVNYNAKIIIIIAVTLLGWYYSICSTLGIDGWLTAVNYIIDKSVGHLTSRWLAVFVYALVVSSSVSVRIEAGWKCFAKRLVSDRIVSLAVQLILLFSRIILDSLPYFCSYCCRTLCHWFVQWVQCRRLLNIKRKKLRTQRVERKWIKKAADKKWTLTYTMEMWWFSHVLDMFQTYWIAYFKYTGN